MLTLSTCSFIVLPLKDEASLLSGYLLLNFRSFFSASLGKSLPLLSIDPCLRKRTEFLVDSLACRTLFYCEAIFLLATLTFSFCCAFLIAGESSTTFYLRPTTRFGVRETFYMLKLVALGDTACYPPLFFESLTYRPLCVPSRESSMDYSTTEILFFLTLPLPIIAFTRSSSSCSLRTALMRSWIRLFSLKS